MFGMFNPMSAVTGLSVDKRFHIMIPQVPFHATFSVLPPSGNLPSVGGSDEPEDKERDAEEEKLRQEAIKRAEEERRVKHKKFEEEREGIRQGIREKVRNTGRKLS